MKYAFLHLFLMGSFLLADANSEKEYVKLGSLPKLEFGQGQERVVKIPFQVISGYHVQSNPAAPRLIATTLTIDAVDGFKVGTPAYPKGKPFRLKTGGREISVFEGTFEIAVPISIPVGTKTGATVLKARLRYQACDEMTCYFPKNLPFEIPIQVTNPQTP